MVVVLMFVPLLAACSGDGRGSADVQRKAMGQEGSDQAMKVKSDKIIRRARGSGRWFPGGRRELETTVSGCMSAAEVPAGAGRIVGAIAPHAGFQYSGKVAGYTFKAIQADAAAGHVPETVVILGFSHRAGFPGVALIDGDAIETPLGEAAIDMESTKLLAGLSKRIVVDYSLHGEEHSAENEIPFVQLALPGAKLVVGLVGDHDGHTLNELCSALCELAKKKKILVVASTDMLHDPDYDLVTKTDKATLAKVAAMDFDGVIKGWSMSKQVFCGIMPVAVVMKFAELQGCKKGTVLYYRNSGDDYPESRGSWVVGYGAVVFALP
jgi:AmmeMemoRadiSam system protein B